MDWYTKLFWGVSKPLYLKNRRAINSDNLKFYILYNNIVAFILFFHLGVYFVNDYRSSIKIVTFIFGMFCIIENLFAIFVIKKHLELTIYVISFSFIKTYSFLIILSKIDFMNNNDFPFFLFFILMSVSYIIPKYLLIIYQFFGMVVFYFEIYNWRTNDEVRKEMLYIFIVLFIDILLIERILNLRIKYINSVIELEVTKSDIIAQQQTIYAALENSDIDIWEYDISRNLLIKEKYKSDNTKSLLCVTLHDFINSENIKVSSIEDFLELHRRVRNGERLVQKECCFVLTSGMQTWKQIRYETIFDDNGTPVRAVGCSVDVTKSKRSEERYNDEVRYSNFIFDKTIIMMKFNLTKNRIVDTKTKVKQLERFRRYKTVDGFLCELYDVLPDKEKVDRYKNIFSRKGMINYYYNDRRTFEFDHRFISDNKYIWIRTKINIMQNPRTGDIEAFVYSFDINNEKNSEYVFKKVVTVNYDFVIMIDVQNGTCKKFELDDETNIKKTSKTYGSYDVVCQKCGKYFIVNNEKNEILEKIKLNNIINYLRNNDVYSVELRAGGKNKNAFNKRLRFSYIDENKYTILMTCTDITDIVQNEEEQKRVLMMALEEAEKANLSKTKFLSSMSHEIRTPMNAIIGLTSLAKQNIDNKEEVLSSLDMVEESSTYLLSLINDILDMSKIESGRLKLSNKVMDFDKFLTTIDTIIRPQSDKKQIKFVVNKINECNKYYYADQLRLQQIVINLLSNAVKFTNKMGKVTFSIEQVSSVNNIATLKFTVQDNGIGISNDFMPYLFKPFSQEYSSNTNSFGGTGLGLSISLSIAKMMNGNIFVESEAGKGSLFIAYVNVEIYDDTGEIESINKDESIRKYNFEGKKVLLVEDHKLNIIVARKLLESRGINVDVATNGPDAIDLFKLSNVYHYDAILMDIRMPKLDGYETTGIIRELEREDASIVPIIAMTANAFVEDIEKSYKSGMNAHIAKPIEPDIFYETLNKFIG